MGGKSGEMGKIRSLPVLIGSALLFLIPLAVHAVPIRLADGESSRYFVIVKEDLSSYPCTTTIKNTELLGSPIHVARIRIEYWDADKNYLGSEDFEIDCQPNEEEWFRWHASAGTKYYRYIFY